MLRRDLTAIYFIGFLDFFAVGLIIPLFQKHLRELGASPSLAGMLGSVYGALQLFSSPIIGKWSDLFGCRFVLLWCLLLCAVSYAQLIFARTLTFFVLSRVFAGIFKHTQSLAKTYLAQSTSENEHSVVFGQFNSVTSIGFILGPIVGGHVAERDDGFYIVSAITAVSFIVLYVVVLIFIPHKLEPNSSNAVQQTVENDESSIHLLKYIRALNWEKLWDILIVRFFMGIGMLAYRSNFALILEYRYGAPAIVNGYLISYSAFVSTVTSFFTGRIAKFYSSDARLLKHAQILQFISLTLLIFVPSLWYLPVCLTLLSMSNALARVASINITLAKGRKEDVGALVGLGASILSLARMAAPTLGGLAQEVSDSGPCVLAATFSFLGLAVWHISLNTQKPKRE